MPKINREVQDPIVAKVVNHVIDRSEIGIQKYGITLERGDLNTIEWIQHFQEELLDGANYAEVLKTKISIIQRMMAAPTMVEKVKDWCTIFDASKEPWLWMTLVIEEFSETLEAFGFSNIRVLFDSETKAEMDKVKLLDGICDLIWVTIGLGLSFHWNVDKAFEEVYESNMSKLGEDGKPIKRDDGKIMKGPNFREPRLKKFVDEGDKSRFGDITGFKK